MQQKMDILNEEIGVLTHDENYQLATRFRVEKEVKTFKKGI